MDWQRLVEQFVSAFLGAGIVKLLDWVFENVRQGKRRKEEKVNRVEEYLNELAELASLYRFFARAESTVETDERGKPLKDEDGKIVFRERILEPEPRFEEAIRAMQGTDLNSAIAQKIARIQLESGEVLDLVRELDPGGDLNKKLAELHWQTTSATEFLLKQKAFKEFGDALRKADKSRREIRSVLEKYRS
jgi:NTP pyrophosphatase (non-canonical NTP hydrolase)